MVRFLAIFLLVLLAFRLIARLIAVVALRGRPQARRPPGPVGTSQRRQLAQCSRCGVHFDPKTALTSGDNSEMAFCSPECRRGPKAKGRGA